MSHSSKDAHHYTVEDADKSIARNEQLIEKNNKLLADFEHAKKKLQDMLDSYEIDFDDIVELEKQIRDYSTDYRIPEDERTKIQELLTQAEIEVQNMEGIDDSKRHALPHSGHKSHKTHINV